MPGKIDRARKLKIQMVLYPNKMQQIKETYSTLCNKYANENDVYAQCFSSVGAVIDKIPHCDLFVEKLYGDGDLMVCRFMQLMKRATKLQRPTRPFYVDMYHAARDIYLGDSPRYRTLYEYCSERPQDLHKLEEVTSYIFKYTSDLRMYMAYDRYLHCDNDLKPIYTWYMRMLDGVFDDL